MLLVLNLKMNLSKNEILKYENAIHDKEVIVLPQFPYIPFFRSGKYLLGSQDVSKYSKGAYTGEVCAKGLRDLNCSYVWVGHSERKINFNETINDSRMKIQNVIDNDMIPIYCVNQTEEELTTDKELKNIERINDECFWILLLSEYPFFISEYLILLCHFYMILVIDIIDSMETLLRIMIII